MKSERRLQKTNMKNKEDKKTKIGEKFQDKKLPLVDEVEALERMVAL